MKLNLAITTGILAFGISACNSTTSKKTSESSDQGESRKPNIIFIMADDMGYGDAGVYGQKSILTPAIDQLAREGMMFTQCYSGSTVCAPSRSALMTGQHTGHTTVRGNKSPIPLDLPNPDRV
ncbi:MAG: sulfatase-like hydrolase/transferase, partial [Bacteroidales bacterium]